MSGYAFNEDPAELADVTVDLDDGDGADWTKTSWDLLWVVDKDTLRGHLAEVGSTAAAFKRSVAYRFGRESQPWLEQAVADLIAER